MTCFDLATSLTNVTNGDSFKVGKVTNFHYLFVELTPDDQPAYMYYVNDGVYGSFNCLMYDHAEVEPTLTEVSGV